MQVFGCPVPHIPHIWLIHKLTYQMPVVCRASGQRWVRKTAISWTAVLYEWWIQHWGLLYSCREPDKALDKVDYQQKNPETIAVHLHWQSPQTK